MPSARKSVIKKEKKNKKKFNFFEIKREELQTLLVKNISGIFLNIIIREIVKKQEKTFQSIFIEKIFFESRPSCSKILNFILNRFLSRKLIILLN